MRYRCRMGHIIEEADYCRACLASDFGVRPFQEPAPPPEKKPEERTPIIEPRYAVIKHDPGDDVTAVEVPEGSNLPVSKHPSHPSHKKR